MTKPQLLKKKQRADYMFASACNWRAFNYELGEVFFLNILAMQLLGRLLNCSNSDNKREFMQSL